MVIVVDYGMGNLRSVQKGFEKVGTDAVISRDPDLVVQAEKLVLPGVGAFPQCMKNLTELNLVDPILEFVRSGRPFLGICLGLQLLFDDSEEFGRHEGLKVVPGKVKEFDRNMGLKIPHMGWNQVNFTGDTPIFQGIDNGSFSNSWRRKHCRGCYCHSLGWAGCVVLDVVYGLLWYGRQVFGCHARAKLPSG